MGEWVRIAAERALIEGNNENKEGEN